MVYIYFAFWFVLIEPRRHANLRRDISTIIIQSTLFYLHPMFFFVMLPSLMVAISIDLLRPKTSICVGLS